jgi:hypothetical protein
MLNVKCQILKLGLVVVLVLDASSFSAAKKARLPMQRDDVACLDAFPRNGAGRDALPLDPPQHVRWSCAVHRLRW